MAKQITANANSGGNIIDYYGIPSNQHYGILQSHSLVFDPVTSLRIIRNDPVVKGAIITLVDKTLEAGWRVQGRDKKSRQRILENKLKELRFNPVLRKALFDLFLYNNAYIEIVRDSQGAKDLNVLETTLMRINAQDNGDVISFYQEAGKHKTNPTWTPEQITHVKLNDYTTNVYSESDMQTLYETVLVKDYIRQWVSWFFGTNQMRPVYNFKSKGTQQKITEFVSWLDASSKNLKKPIITEGEMTIQSLMSFGAEGEAILKMLDWCDEQILILLQVPPISVGKPDNSGRSNSVEQGGALGTRVKNVQMIIEDLFSYDLFPKMGFEKNDFKFGSIDFGMTARVMETVQVMKNSMFTDEAIIEFLSGQGVLFDTEEVFKDPVEMAKEMAEASGKMSNDDVGTGNEGSLGNKDMDSAPSRQRQDKGSISKANTKRQVVKNSLPSDKFSHYPYVFEVKDV